MRKLTGHVPFAVNPGKFVRGEKHKSARLTAEDVLDMRTRDVAGESLKDIAARYPQCSKAAVHHVLTYRNWKHIAVLSETPNHARRPVSA